MLRTMRGLVLGGAVFAALAACVPTDPSLTEATKSPEAPAGPVIKQPVPEDFVNAYAARQDGQFAIPAVPEDKIPAHLRRQVVDYASNDPVGTIIIDPTAKTLHLVTAPGKAMRYGIAVGADGFQWSGESLITNRRHWPTWTPPKEMIERKPSLAKWEKGQPGGPTNPLGARALYLTTNGVDHGFRIHGTPEWQSIGRNASSGCFRMINQDVMDLYERVPNGVKVIVLNADGSRPTGLKLPPPKPAKKKAAPKPAAAPTPAVSATNPGAPAPGFPTMTAPVVTPSLGGAPAGITPTVPTAPQPVVAPATPVAPEAPATPAPVVPAAPAAVTPVVPAAPAAPVAPLAPAAPAATPAPAVTPAAPAATCVPTAEKPCP